MPHYYAFCEVHGKCGDNRATPELAAENCNQHVATVSGPHGLVYPRLSNIEIINGVKKYSYKNLKNMAVDNTERNNNGES